jgi:hypothetical protein
MRVVFGTPKLKSSSEGRKRASSSPRTEDTRRDVGRETLSNESS